MTSGRGERPPAPVEIVVTIRGDMARRLDRVAQATTLSPEGVVALLVKYYLDDLVPPGELRGH